MPTDWPSLLLGLIMLTYWGRVIQMVLRARRRDRHGANYIPVERLGWWLRFIWNPVVALWVAVPIATGLVRRDRLPWLFQPLYHLPALAWTALAVAVLAFLATWFCWKKMGRSWRMGINPDEKTQLIISGPYAWLRHPIYALSSLLMLMSMVILPSPLMLGIGVIHLSLLRWEAVREERYLLNLHGDTYRRYASATGRFFPRSVRGFHG